MQKQEGFTLVELAIVLMIIGLLIGGVLRGQELMQNARVSSTIQQVKAYQGAVHTFMDARGALPGDYASADTRLPGCTTTNFCKAGNGNGIIGDLNRGPAGGVLSDEPWANIDNTKDNENFQFWKHLALAHLITGVDPSVGTADWGKSNPVAKAGGGFFMRYAVCLTATGCGGKSSSHYLVSRNVLSGAMVCDSTSSGNCAIDPQKASQIDRKMDDGMANNGDVIAVSEGWTMGCGDPNSGLNGPSGYAQTRTIPSCDMMFKTK